MAKAGALNGADLQTDDVIMNAHRNLVYGKDNDNSWLTVMKPELSMDMYSGNTSVTSFIAQNINYRPTVVEASKVNSTVDSTCFGNSTESSTYQMPSSNSR